MRTVDPRPYRDRWPLRRLITITLVIIIREGRIVTRAAYPCPYSSLLFRPKVHRSPWSVGLLGYFA